MRYATSCGYIWKRPRELSKEAVYNKNVYVKEKGRIKIFVGDLITINRNVCIAQ